MEERSQKVVNDATLINRLIGALNGTLSKIHSKPLVKQLDDDIKPMAQRINLHDNINILSKEKQKHFELVKEAVQKAKDDVDELFGENGEHFEESYTKVITMKFGHLGDRVEVLKAKDPGDGTSDDNKCKLEREVDEVKKAVLNVEKLYTEKLTTIKKEVDLAVNQAVSRLQTVDTAVKTGLQGVRDEIHTQLEEFVDGVGKWIKEGIERASSTYNGFSGEKKGRHRNVLRNLKDDVNGKVPKPSELLQQLQITLTTALETELKAVIDEDPDKIKLKDLMQEYHQETMLNGDSFKLRGMIEAFKGRVKNDGFKGDGHSASFKPEEMKGYQDDKTGGTDQGAKPKYDWAMKNLFAQINDLESLPGAIDVARQATEELMRQLSKSIEGIKSKIESIEQAVTDADQQLEASIGTVTDAYNQAEQKSREAVEQLNTNLQQAVRRSFDQLTSQVQSLFTKQKRAELAALESVVTAQLARIEEIIREDKATGVKGFLRDLKDGITEHILDGPLTASTKLPDLATKLVTFFEPLFEYVDDQLVPRTPGTSTRSPQQPTDPNAAKVRKISGKLAMLLAHLMNNKNKVCNFETQFSNDLASLIDAVNEFGAVKFGEGQHPDLLNIVRTGMNDFAKQLKYAYINMYDTQSIKWQEVKDDDFVLTESAMRCAKIALTTVPILLSEFEVLLKNTSIAGDWYTLSIHLHNNSNALGAFFKTAGYGVPKSEDMSNEELKNKEDFCGEQIHDLLEGLDHKLYSTKKSFQIIDGLPIEHEEQNGLLQKLHGCLVKYFSVCHLTHIDKPRTPCSVYEMLAWCAGLQFNSIFEPLCSYFKELFQKPKDQKDVPYDQIEDSSLSLVGTKTIHPSHLVTALNDVCSRSYYVLVGILGNGHADGVYACEFPSNSLNLSYPSSPSQCFAILADVLCRLYEQLYLLYEQCKHGQFCSGWNKCWYGRGVAGSSWSCNTLQCPNQTGDQTATQSTNQKHNQRCDQNCKQHSDCGIKSPLQSFLEDGLVGFLPHQLTKLGCGVACSVGSHRGQPCITPMGFPDLSVMASHRQTGRYLEEVLADFCGKPDKPLSKLCSYLTCISQRTPQTLGDLFAFYFNFLDKWNSNDGHKRYAFINAVQSANFGDPKTTLEIGPMFGSSDHAGQTHPNADLHSLVKCESNSGDASLPCGPYLMPICRDIWNTFSSKNSGKYLSWIVYLSETFYDLLKKLYDDCCATCDRKGSRCYEKRCSETCKVKYTDKDGQPTTLLKNAQHTSDCSSIVKCPHTLRTLSKYGFYFGSSWRMSGERGEKTKRTCRDLCQALDRVLSKKKEDRAALAKLIYETIPNFLWKIREPFSLTLVALWSLSLLYLLHITVVRLDVLRIRSHLRSPSSHRIAAQSLLAAARVKALANVKYFSP
ncbi:hypothetical protein, conserved [Babesia ovata]|uniref:C3H1-type domain-containing protein n=1 Tax=Babesia ovata TaxID=189622 RepID=A0A2H6KAG5_9APIC|nr:uncharacterized protein BOVATA_014690 [Babesia ovata]GBE59976.1 hypothetical protein, conserved [Babesia ovata]